jgi:hypothetical protein
MDASTVLSLDTVACVLRQCRLKDVMVCCRVSRLWNRAVNRPDVFQRMREKFCCAEAMRIYLSPFLDSSLVAVEQIMSSWTFSKHDMEECDDERASHACRDGKRANNWNFPKVSTFEAVGLDAALLRGLFAYGLERPSRVQQACLIPLAHGLELVLRAQAGVGKVCG